MSIDISSTSSTPNISAGLLSGGVSNLRGLPQAQQIKAASKAMEGMFVGQLMSEMGKGLDGKDAKEGGMYQDFIQQALSQQITSGGGFGLAKFLESSITPAKAHTPLATTPEISHHAHGTR